MRKLLALFAFTISLAAQGQTLVNPLNGGTGIANANTKTITLGGPLVTSGAYTTTFTATGTTGLTLPTSGTLATTSNKLSAFAATTSAELAGVLSDESGTGVFCMTVNCQMTTPSLGAATATYLTNGTANGVNYGIITPATNTGTGSLTFQAGGGSVTYGGGLILYSHSNASFPGWFKAGISYGSGGKFAVNSKPDGTGIDVFTVDSSGNTVANGSITASSISVGAPISITPSVVGLTVVLNGGSVAYTGGYYTVGKQVTWWTYIKPSGGATTAVSSGGAAHFILFSGTLMSGGKVFGLTASADDLSTGIFTSAGIVSYSGASTIVYCPGWTATTLGIYLSGAFVID